MPLATGTPSGSEDVAQDDFRPGPGGPGPLLSALACFGTGRGPGSVRGRARRRGPLTLNPT